MEGNQKANKGRNKEGSKGRKFRDIRMYVCFYIGENLEGNCHQLLFLWKPSQIDANSPISFVISVRTSVCLYVYSMYHLSSHWMEFHEIYF